MVNIRRMKGLLLKIPTTVNYHYKVSFLSPSICLSNDDNKEHKKDRISIVSSDLGNLILIMLFVSFGWYLSNSTNLKFPDIAKQTDSDTLNPF